MSQEEAKQQAWDTYKEAKTKLDESVKLACLSVEEFCEAARKDAYAAMDRAERERDEDIGKIYESFAGAYDKVEREYKEAFVIILNTEVEA